MISQENQQKVKIRKEKNIIYAIKVESEFHSKMYRRSHFQMQ